MGCFDEVSEVQAKMFCLFVVLFCRAEFCDDETLNLVNKDSQTSVFEMS